MAIRSPNTSATVRSMQYRDWEVVDRLLSSQSDRAERAWLVEPLCRHARPWNRHPLLKIIDQLPLQLSSPLRTYVLEEAHQIQGLIQVSPINQSRSTWRIGRSCQANQVSCFDAGSQLLRYCLENIWEARTWLVEVEVNHRDTLGLYRHNGFQPLAQLTRWQLSPAVLAQVAQHEPSLPNLLPVSNADASLLYQLDTAAMPPFVRQVFDRHPQDFKRGLMEHLAWTLQSQFQDRVWTNSYVFEAQRKAAIGYFGLSLSPISDQVHQVQLTVHPAYTWLYPELLACIAQQAQAACADAPLEIISTDYQPEREDYLRQIGGTEVEFTLMLSRSVWHKVRESKTLSLETLQLADVLQGLQPNHTPVPGRISFLKSMRSPTAPSPAFPKTEPPPPDEPGSSDVPKPHGSCG